MQQSEMEAMELMMKRSKRLAMWKTPVRGLPLTLHPLLANTHLKMHRACLIKQINRLAEIVAQLKI